MPDSIIMIEVKKVDIFTNQFRDETAEWLEQHYKKYSTNIIDVQFSSAVSSGGTMYYSIMVTRKEMQGQTPANTITT
jgi:hypothetical protein